MSLSILGYIVPVSGVSLVEARARPGLAGDAMLDYEAAAGAGVRFLGVARAEGEHPVTFPEGTPVGSRVDFALLD
jgi:hypothetical protein